MTIIVNNRLDEDLPKYTPEASWGENCDMVIDNEDGEYWKISDVVKELELIDQHPELDDMYKLKIIRSHFEMYETHT